jgi:DNA-binding transcriptional LysR family regulator
LIQHHCIRFRFASGRLFKWEFEQGDTRIDIDVQGRLTLGNQNLMTRAALDGVGLGFVFEDLVLEHVSAGRLVRVLSDWCPSFPGFFLYYPRQRRMPSALRAFIDMARAPA